MPSLKHTHTYIKSRWNKKVYRCADPECSHYNNILKIVGKKSCCTKCSREFVLSMYDLTHTASPKCQLCSNRKDAVTARAIAKDPLIQDLFSHILKEDHEKQEESRDVSSRRDSTEGELLSETPGEQNTSSKETSGSKDAEDDFEWS